MHEHVLSYRAIGVLLKRKTVEQRQIAKLNKVNYIDEECLQMKKRVRTCGYHKNPTVYMNFP